MPKSNREIIKVDFPQRPYIKTIAKGSLLTVAGTALGIILNLLLRLILARGLGTAQYGEFVLAYTIVGLASIFVTLGMTRTLSRFLPFFEARKLVGRSKGLFKFSGIVGISTSLVIAILLFLFAKDIAVCFSGGKNLTWILRIFAIGLPFVAMGNLTLGALRGFKNISDFVLIQNLLNPGFKLIVAFCILFIFHKSLGHLATGYVICFGASFLISLICLFRSNRVFNKWSSIRSENNTREILNFSLPLLGSDLLGSFRYRADAIILGYMMSVTEVGLYYVCIPVARALQLVLTSVNKIFMPSMSELYSKNNFEDLRHIYGRVSLWIFYATFPMFLMICTFPEIIIEALFGEKYISSSGALIILSFGFFINAVSGPFGETFIAIGRPRLNMYASFISLGINIGLMVTFIPIYGLSGAATAASTSLVCGCLFGSGMLYRYSKLQPFRREHLKSIIAISLAFVGPAYTFNLISSVWQTWILPIFIVFVYATSFLSLLFLGCFDDDELKIFESVINRLPIRLHQHMLKLSKVRVKI